MPTYAPPGGAGAGAGANFVRRSSSAIRGDPGSISSWLRKHGKAARPELTRTQRAELAECFSLIDEDESGAIDTRELEEAFKVLGVKARTRGPLTSLHPTVMLFQVIHPRPSFTRRLFSKAPRTTTND